MEITGTCLYAAISTRPDIAHATQRLSRNMQAPTETDMQAAERLLCYLGNTKKLGLTFGQQRAKAKVSEVQVLAFADADWANDKSDRKSVTGWVAKINGDAVSWASKKQRTVAQSTCEAELYAEAAAINELLWLRGLLTELGVDIGTTSRLYGDNQSTITISKNGINSEKTKHVDVKYHFVTENMVENKGQIDLAWIESSEMQADIFTKGLARPQFIKLRDLLMPPMKE
jgi:hypothetical protein